METPTRAQTTLTVMTYNVGNGRADPARLAARLAQSGADLIGLQELNAAQASALQHLSAAYPHQTLFPNGFAGKGLLSRFPIRQARLIELGPERPDMQAQIELPGGPLNLVNAHPTPPRLTRRGLRFHPAALAQIETLAALAAASDPCLLIGDFNFTPAWGEYGLLCAAGLGDAFAEGGRLGGATLPVRLGPWKRYLWLNHLLKWLPLWPLFRVDYIWRSASIRVQRAWVGPDGGSDHLPLLAQVSLIRSDHRP